MHASAQTQVNVSQPRPGYDTFSELHGQLVIYDLLRRLFLTGPSHDLFQAIRAADRASLGLPNQLDHELGKLQEAIETNLECSQPWIESLLVEFTRLMVGPGETPVVPYGSFYLSPTRNLMTEETLAVRAMYFEAGMSVECLNRIPDDHLGIELEFLYWLTQRAIAATEAERVRWLDLRDRFIRDHYSKWVPDFANALEHAATEPFFRAVSALLLKV